MRTPASWTSKFHAVCIVIAALVPGCTSSLPAAPAEAPPATTMRVVPVHGTLVARGDAMEGRLEPFQSPSGVGRGALEFYVRAFPSEEFDARVVDVQSYGDAWYTATIRLEQPDARLASGTAFEGSLVVTTEERSALCWEPVP